MKKKLLSECMQTAISLLPKHPMDKFRHFTFIIQDNKVVGWGINRFGEAPPGFGYDENSEIHSEVDAFRRCRSKVNINRPFKVVNIRLSKEGDRRMSRPCSCCNGFLETMGADDVYFTTESGWAKMIL
jgi:hypothetical protein